uniref:Uncharacterized protein n=1 Tax=Avena sativa TaxID=4498 RepID=A0ACD5V8V3_AVESA
MWGLNIQMQLYVPKETSKSTNEDRFPICKGMESFLNDREVEVNVDMMVSKRCIEMAGVIYECDRCVDEHGDSLRFVAEDLMEVSQIDTRDWDLMKLSMVLMMIWCPEDKISSARKLVPEELLDRLMTDAPMYEDKISRNPCIELYNEIYSARKIRFEAAKVLFHLLKQAKKEYEDGSRQSRK